MGTEDASQLGWISLSQIFQLLLLFYTSFAKWKGKHYQQDVERRKLTISLKTQAIFKRYLKKAPCYAARWEEALRSHYESCQSGYVTLIHTASWINWSSLCLNLNEAIEHLHNFFFGRGGGREKWTIMRVPQLLCKKVEVHWYIGCISDQHR